MARCSNCGAEGPRVRSKWTEDGQLPDECPSCAPESFERFTTPFDKKIWPGWEAHPNEYDKRYDEKTGEVSYERKQEYRAEQEERLVQLSAEEQERQNRAVARKRAERRTMPMDEAELAAAMKKAEMIAEWVNSAAGQGTDVN